MSKIIVQKSRVMIIQKSVFTQDFLLVSGSGMRDCGRFVGSAPENDEFWKFEAVFEGVFEGEFLVSSSDS